MTGIPECDPDDDPSDVYGRLAEVGAIIVRDLAPPTEIDAVRAELSPFLRAAAVEDDEPDAFYPGRTRRVVAVMHRAPTARTMMMHPMVTALGDHHLRENAKSWTLNVSAALEVGPGARDQVLHREEDLYPFFPCPRPNLILASMWALTDFTADNGGTRIVPGSHRWDADRQPRPEEVVRAEMSAGSVLFWLGGTLHGAGANVTEDEWRLGLQVSYCAGWIRPFTNHFLSIERETAAKFPDRLLELVGYGTFNGAIGTIGKPGTHRFANSAFRRPASVLGR